MAPMITHIVIGERVFGHLPHVIAADYGPFLLGCALVDVHMTSDIRRRTTHLAERLVNDGPYAFHQSCANFLTQLPQLLARPQDQLSRAELAFIAGYLCHLAADEDWKQFDWDIWQASGRNVWSDPAIPGEVILTGFDVLSSRLYLDFGSVAAALQDVTVPHLFNHIPYPVLTSTWRIAKPHAMNGRTVESYIGMLQRMGRNGTELQATRREHEDYWDAAVDLIQELFGGAGARVQAMVQHALDTLTQEQVWLWNSAASRGSTLPPRR